MKKIFSACALFLLIIGMLVFFISSSSEDNKISPDIYKNLEKNNEIKVIVELNEIDQEKGFLIKKEKNDSEIQSEKNKIKEDIIKKIGEENIRHIFDKELALEVSREDINELKENPNIKSIKIDRIMSAFLQDSVPLINASTSWIVKISNLNLTGINETICILDTGANFSHPDLVGKNKTCVIDCFNKSCVENCSVSDDHGHGTHIAGIAAASGSINGVAIGANLISVKVLDASGSGTDSDLNAGIEWCINNSALYNISVMSVSLGTNCIQTPQYCYDHYCDNESNEASISLRVNNATAKNISMIIAAGNNGNYTHISSPACIQNATSVGWANKVNTIAANANRNNITDLFAPGTSINSTRWSGSSCLSGCSCSGNYMTCSGSSMATPHVSGAFAIIRQFFRTQNNRAPTPSEIQDILNNSGKIIFDSSSGLNFSRIDIYSGIISIDYLNPNVNLSNPNNDTNQISKNLTFNCIADDVKLSNVTLYVWNSTGVYNNTITKQTNSISSNVEFNLTNISSDIYQWNCLVYDHKSNFSFASINFSFQIYNLISTLNSPFDNSYSKQNSINFNCSGETENTNTLTNVTFYLWNSTHLIYNLTEDLSGNINSTIFNYNFTSQLNYSWNCLFSNNISRLIFANKNYSIIYDSTKPVINLINPSDSSSYTSSSQSITFRYNVSDNFNLKNCSLVINNIITSTNSSINQNQEQNFSQTFTPENYLWRINCTDLAGNEENSSQRSFIVTSPPSQPLTALGGGGGGEPAYNTYVLSSNETSKSYTKELKNNDRIKFSFFDNKAFEHIIIINEVKTNSVNISILSKPINLILGIGQSAKLNLTSPDYYDLYIKLDSIESKKAVLTIQLINEPIPKFQEEKAIEGLINKTEEEASEKIKKEGIKSYEIEKFKNNIFIFAIIFIVIISIIILIVKKGKHKNKKKKIKEYSEIFDKNIRPKKENLYKRNLIIKD